MAGRDGLQHVKAGVGELIADGLRHLAVRVLRDPALGPGNGVGEALHHVGMRGHITLAGEIGSIGDLAGGFADGTQDVAVTGPLHLGGGGLKQRHIVPLTTGEGTGHHVELHGGVHHRVHLRHHAVLLHDVLQRHLRHTALAAADDRGAPQVLPGEAAAGAAHQERTVPLGELGKDHGVVVLALIVDIDAALRPRQTDVGAAGHHGGHDLIRPAAVGQLHVQPLVGEEAQAHGHVLRRVEHGVCHLVEPHRGGTAAAAAGEQHRKQQGGDAEKCQQFLHDRTPQ